jgi:hypothetical protein
VIISQLEKSLENILLEKGKKDHSLYEAEKIQKEVDLLQNEIDTA